MNYNEIASQIIKLAGNIENIIEASHCMTRLRLHLKSYNDIDTEAIKGVDGVLGVNVSDNERARDVARNAVRAAAHTACRMFPAYIIK